MQLGDLDDIFIKYEKKGLYGKLSTLSVLSLHIAIDSILPLTQTSMYFISHLSYNNPKITSSDIYFFYKY